MPGIERTSTGTWRGNLKAGSGTISATSGVLSNAPFTFATRFENARGTNPEELIAAAHAACYSMAFSHYLSEHGHVPDEITTTATITLDAGVINKMHLKTVGKVPGLTAGDFQRMADEAEKKCPVSNLLRHGLSITLEAALA
jgi:osmotically inducible protein OsmC